MKDITIEEAISQVNDFIKDREFFIENDDDNDDEVEVFKKDTQAIETIMNAYFKEKARADKLEKDFSKALSKLDEKGVS